MKLSILEAFTLLLSVNIAASMQITGIGPFMDTRNIQIEMPMYVMAGMKEQVRDLNKHIEWLRIYGYFEKELFDAETEVKFILNTQEARNEEISMNLESIRNSSFDSRNPTRVLIHGWQGSLLSEVNGMVTEAYLSRKNFNCISVDWSKGAATLDYVKARSRIYDVAHVTAKLIDFLHEHDYLEFKQLHVVGHSLGGHTAGLVGKYVTRGRVQAIFGLDPAGPKFSLDKPNERIASTDGVYVEVIHTNGGNFGFMKPLGQADFYPDYGRIQPGCMMQFGQCSHNRASILFAESIKTPNKFISKLCGSFKEIQDSDCKEISSGYKMGPVNVGLSGIFYLTTVHVSELSKKN